MPTWTIFINGEHNTGEPPRTRGKYALPLYVFRIEKLYVAYYTPRLFLIPPAVEFSCSIIPCHTTNFFLSFDQVRFRG
jgi:hypothetical protein